MARSPNLRELRRIVSIYALMKSELKFLKRRQPLAAKRCDALCAEIDQASSTIRRDSAPPFEAMVETCEDLVSKFNAVRETFDGE